MEKSIVKCLFNEELSIDLYESGEELLDAVNNDSFFYNVVFIDTDLNTISGFDVAEAFRRRNVNSEIVFISGNRDAVFDSFRFHPFDYLVKPICVDKLGEMFERYRFYHDDKTEEYFSFKTSSVDNRIRIKSILYFSSSGRKIVVATQKEKFEFYSKLDEVENVVNNDSFIRVHQSFLVNSHYIKYLLKNDIVLENEEYIPISRNRLKDVREEYIRLLSNA